VRRGVAPAILVPLLVLAAGTPAAAAAPKGAPAKPAAARADLAGSPLTGDVTEARFKALHELKKGEAPKLYGKEIRLDGARAYLSLPAHPKGRLPAVILVHEWWGLNANIEHWADRLAADGYAALAVDLYGGKVATTPDEAMALMKKVDARRSIAILRAARRYLVRSPKIRARRIGILGWCFGGGWSLRGGLALPRMSAVVMYYGHPILDPKRLSHLHAPLLGIFGNLDPSIPPKTVDAFDAALTRAKVKHTFLRYDATHAFANPSGARYDEKAASDAWKHVRAFLARHLKRG